MATFMPFRVAANRFRQPFGTTIKIGAYALLAGISAAAHAQAAETLLLSPDYPDGFRAFRQLGVNEQGDGEWAANGITAGSFTIAPKLSTEVAGTTNAYTSVTDNIATPFITVSPTIQANSNWSRHWLGILADADFARYLGESRRDENRWNLSSSGVLNVNRPFSIYGQLSASQMTLNRFSGELSSDATSVAVIRQNNASITFQYHSGKARIIVGAEFFNLNFKRILLIDGSSSDQSARNHNVQRFNTQLEYSPIPDVTLFTQAVYAQANYYQMVTPSLSISDFSSVRGLAGVRWEIQGLARATVAGGYARRNFSGLGYAPIGRFSAEARLEIFPSALTTVTIEGMHRLSEARLIDSAPLMQNSLHVNASHALRRNLKFGLDAVTLRQSYLLATQVSRIQSLALTGRLLVTPNWELGARLTFSKRHTTGASTDYSIQETNGGISATFKL